MGQLFYPAGSLTSPGFTLDVDPGRAGWQYCGLKVLELPAGGAKELVTGSAEAAVIPLAGSCAVEVEGKHFEVDGREDVFSGIAGFAYVPIDTSFRVSSSTGGEVAVCMAEATRRIDPYVVPAKAVAVEVRGAATASRQINNFLNAVSWEADKLIAVEVTTLPRG